MRALALALLAAGCASDPCAGVDGACVALTVDGSGRVDTLLIALSGAQTSTAAAPTYATPADLPVYVGLELGKRAPDGRVLSFYPGGGLHIAVQARYHASVLGSGTTAVTLGPQDHVAATVTLGAGGGPGGGDDGSAVPTTDDLATGPDLSCPMSDMDSVANDPHNCGLCGHDCGGGACVNGVCQPIVVDTPKLTPSGIALDANHLYVAALGSAGGIRRVPLSGGPDAPIYSENLSSTSLAFGIDTLYFVGALGIESVPAPAGAASATKVGTMTANAVATDASHLYYANGANVYSLPLPPGSATATLVATLSAGATALASDGTTLFWSANNGTLGTVTLPSGTPTTYNTWNQGAATAMAADASTLYVCANLRILALAHSGATLSSQTDVETSENCAGLAVDDKYLYWSNSATQTVKRVVR